MTSEQIDKFLSEKVKSDSAIRISFKNRNSVVGVFIETPDFNELKSKNFWRIVSESNLAQWKKSRDFSLCRMFNGAEFTKLAVA